MLRAIEENENHLVYVFKIYDRKLKREREIQSVGLTPDSCENQIKNYCFRNGHRFIEFVREVK